MIVFGIDPSLTGTAVCSIEHSSGTRVRVITSKPASDLHGRIRRYEQLTTDVWKCVRDHTAELPVEVLRHNVAIFIEGYSYGVSRQAGTRDIAEYGGILRQQLIFLLTDVYEVPPASLKKFATGKGNADKLAVGLACQKRWGVSYETSDEFDAYVLARIGRVYVGLEEPETAFQREVVEELRHGKAKKQRKQKPVTHE